MNKTECTIIQERLDRQEKKLQAIHDDVLVLKTKWNLTWKAASIVAGAIALIISLGVKFLGG